MSATRRRGVAPRLSRQPGGAATPRPPWAPARETAVWCRPRPLPSRLLVERSRHTTPRARRTHTECADVTSGVAFRGVTAGGRAVLTLHSASRSEELCPAVDELCQLPQGHQPDHLEHKRPCERPANF